MSFAFSLQKPYFTEGYNCICSNRIPKSKNLYHINTEKDIRPGLYFFLQFTFKIFFELKVEDSVFVYSILLLLLKKITKIG